jgi:AcrR family transcriptional regulator
MAQAATENRKRSARRPGRDAAGPRDGRRAQRRQAILAAALKEFSARGFAAARLDDVAVAAGIAMGPVVATLETALAVDLPVRMVAERAVELFVREVYGTSRRDIVRLILSEGPRFPQLADFYYREVLSRIIAAVRALLSRALERGELRSDALIRFPQLLAAPGIVAVLWSALFERHDPLDVQGLMRAHLDFLFGQGEAT